MASNMAQQAYPPNTVIDFGDSVAVIPRTPEELEMLQSSYDRGAREAIQQVLDELPGSVRHHFEGTSFPEAIVKMVEDIRAADRRMIEAIRGEYI